MYAHRTYPALAILTHTIGTPFGDIGYVVLNRLAIRDGLGFYPFQECDNKSSHCVTS